MGKVRATISGFITVNGRHVQLDEGDEFDADHEVVQARPDVFGPAAGGTAAGPAAAASKRRARSPRIA